MNRALYITEAPEVVQRKAVTRSFNQKCADLRILDREFYRAYRKFIRIPCNRTEADRNERWKDLRALLGVARIMTLRKAGIALFKSVKQAQLDGSFERLERRTAERAKQLGCGWSR